MPRASGTVVNARHDLDKLARVVARAVACSDPDALPADVSRHALRTLVNFVGCAVGGSTHDAVEKLQRASGAATADAGASVLGRPGLVPSSAAALLNGLAGAANAFDDTHAEAVVHAGTPVGAALVALSGDLPMPVPGGHLLNAYAWGVELACRLSKAVSVAPARTSVGWSQTGIAAPVGAAVACSNLLGLDEQATASAIGIAATWSSGMRVANGTMAMHLIPARAAALGLESARFAQAGVTGPDDVFEGRHGFFEILASPACAEHLVARLGSHFELLANTFKAYPCGIVIHAVIDACLQLRCGTSARPSTISEVVLKVSPLTAALTDLPHPIDSFAAQVSVQHWAAVSLLRGEAGLEGLSREALEDDEIRSLRDRCRLVVNEERSSDSALVMLRTPDGRTYQAQVDHCSGSSSRPLDDAAISRKFLSQASPVLGARAAEDLLARCWSIPTAPDVRQLWRV